MVVIKRFPQELQNVIWTPYNIWALSSIEHSLKIIKYITKNCTKLKKVRFVVIEYHFQQKFKCESCHRKFENHSTSQVFYVFFMARYSELQAVKKCTCSFQKWLWELLCSFVFCCRQASGKIKGNQDGFHQEQNDVAVASDHRGDGKG